MKNTIHSIKYSSGKISCSAHYHNCHQILFVTQGNATVVLNDKERPLTSGKILILNRFEQHSIKSPSENYERFILRIEPQAQYSGDPRLFSIILNRPNNFINIIDCEEDFQKIKFTFERLTSEFDSTSPMSKTMTELLFNQLLIYIYRHIKLDFPHYDSISFSTILKAENILSVNYYKKISLKQLADALSVSPSLLSHSFKKITGMSVMNYLLACRIAEAKSQLIKTDMPIGRIAEQCGFSDFSNFSRIFKKMTGYTPSQYLKTFKY